MVTVDRLRLAGFPEVDLRSTIAWLGCRTRGVEASYRHRLPLVVKGCDSLRPEIDHHPGVPRFHLHFPAFEVVLRGRIIIPGDGCARCCLTRSRIAEIR